MFRLFVYCICVIYMILMFWKISNCWANRVYIVNTYLPQLLSVWFTWNTRIRCSHASMVFAVCDTGIFWETTNLYVTKCVAPKIVNRMNVIIKSPTWNSWTDLAVTNVLFLFSFLIHSYKTVLHQNCIQTYLVFVETVVINGRFLFIFKAKKYVKGIIKLNGYVWCCVLV